MTLPLSTLGPRPVASTEDRKLTFSDFRKGIALHAVFEVIAMTFLAVWIGRDAHRISGYNPSPEQELEAW